MEKPVTAIDQSSIYYRLTALWVVCEALLGGIIHGMKLPVSGLIVGSSAVVCICLLAWYVPARGMILKATIIVAIFKMMLSPQSPLPAYFAVFFQGLLGEILFYNRRKYKFICIFFSVLALLESALQRILVVTLLYGKGIWIAVNDFISSFARQSLNYSIYLVGFYVSAHLLTGIIIGIFAASLPHKFERWQQSEMKFQQIDEHFQLNKKKKPVFRSFFFLIWIALLLIFIQAYLKIGKPILPAHVSLQILFRSLAILLTWYFLISPILIKLLKKWLLQKKGQWRDSVDAVIDLLPATKAIVVKSWQLSASKKGLNRLREFSKIVLLKTITNA